MIEKVVTVTDLEESSAKDDLSFWLSRLPVERLEAVDILRQRVFDVPAQMERILKVVDLDLD